MTIQETTALEKYNKGEQFSVSFAEIYTIIKDKQYYENRDKKIY